MRLHLSSLLQGLATAGGHVSGSFLAFGAILLLSVMVGTSFGEEPAVSPVSPPAAGEKTPPVLGQLRIGRNQPGSLRPHIAVTRQVRTLQLEYQLLDAQGQKHAPQSPDRANPPRFIVYCDGQEVGSGAFEYG